MFDAWSHLAGTSSSVGGTVRVNGFSYVSKSGIESKLLHEQLAEGELRRSSFKGV